MENISKRIVELESGRIVGYVLDVALDKTTFEKIGYYVADEETEGEYLLRNEDIKSVGDEIVMENVQKLEFLTQRDGSMLGKIVVNGNGINYGSVEKVVFEKKKLKKICTDRCEIMTKFISFCGENCVVLKGKNAHVRSFLDKNSIFKKDFLKEPVSVLETKKENFAPEKLNLSYEYFVGKVSIFDVFGYNNERIVTKGQKITKNIFENAKKNIIN